MEEVERVLGGGRYELHELLGTGGTGSVRRGHDTLLDRPVAVKMLRGSGDETTRARMRAEAQLAGSLHHPGVAQVYDYGEDDDGDEPAPYIVMQHVEGTTLWQVLHERGTLPPHEVMDVVAQVADALRSAHEAGIVHRDLKPGNILLTPDHRVVLVDFGIARTHDGEPLTATGTIVGTADYISPEQSEGRSATASSDLYSLGMVAYECLTGRRPFRRETDVATALAHLRERAPRLGPEVPVAVRALVEQLIAKHPDDRPADAAEVAARAAALAVPAALESPPVSLRLAHLLGARPRGARSLVATLRHPALRSRRTRMAAAVLLVAAVGSVFVAARSPATRVPDLRGERIAAAARTLDDRGLRTERTIADDPRSPRGTVLHQDPAPGVQAADGAVVTLTVASGRSVLHARDVVGEPYQAAARDLVALGLVPARAGDGPARAGVVVAAEPAGRLRLGTTVRLTVGSTLTPTGPMHPLRR